MFGLANLLAAIARLTASINAMADTFDAGTAKLLPPVEEPPALMNGRAKKVVPVKD